MRETFQKAGGEILRTRRDPAFDDRHRKKCAALDFRAGEAKWPLVVRAIEFHKLVPRPVARGNASHQFDRCLNAEFLGEFAGRGGRVIVAAVLAFAGRA